MTDIREKVARAIWHSFHAETMDTDGKAEALLMADAALSACRYQEMRQALETLVRLNDIAYSSDYEQWLPIWVEANRVARATLGGGE